jgi:Flp pilus assembly protein TadG
MGSWGFRSSFATKRSRQQGASAVEMAVLAPFLILLLFGVIESSWLIARSLDVAQAAREAGRMAGVNDGDETTIIIAVCNGMDEPAGAQITLSGAGNGLGGNITATAEQDVNTITGLLDPLFSPPVHISHTTTFRLEQTAASWTDTTGSC